MTEVKEKEHWYYNEVIICTGIVLGVFGLIFTLIHFGASVKNAVEVGVGILVGCMLLPLIDPIRDLIKWIKKRKTNTQESQS